MATDLRIQTIITTTNLITAEKSEFINLLSQRTPNKRNDVSEISNNINKIENLKKSAEDKDDLKVIFNLQNVHNTDQKLDLIERQTTAYVSFLKDYPEFSQLKRSEIEALLKIIIDKSTINQNPFITSYLLGEVNSKNQVMDCAQSWARAVSGCELAYNLALIGIWADVAIAAAASSGFLMGPAIATGFVQTGIAYAASEACISYATAEFYGCF